MRKCVLTIMLVLGTATLNAEVLAAPTSPGAPIAAGAAGTSGLSSPPGDAVCASYYFMVRQCLLEKDPATLLAATYTDYVEQLYARHAAAKGDAVAEADIQRALVDRINDVAKNCNNMPLLFNRYDALCKKTVASAQAPATSLNKAQHLTSQIQEAPMETVKEYLPLFFISLVFGFPAYIVARSKGYTGFIPVILCFCPVLNWFTGLMYVGLPDLVLRNMLSEAQQNKALTTCPWCAEPILAKAIVCKHCGRDVHSTDRDQFMNE